MNKINIILFGPPGAGKGTQSGFLIKAHGLKHISTGDILRKEIQDEMPWGALAKRVPICTLVPDEIVIGMVKNFILINSNASGFLFDGFPRTVEQAIALDAMLAQEDESISRVLFLDVQRDELIRRLLERGKTSKRADDQDPSIILTRLEEYEKKTLPVLAYYEEKEIVTIIDGNRDIPTIEEDIDVLMVALSVPNTMY